MTRMMQCVFAGAAIASPVLGGGSPVVLQPPGDPGGTIRSATTQRVADNFTAPTSAAITTIGWWGTAGSAESGDWLIEIYADDGAGGVGASLYEEMIPNIAVDQSPFGLRSYWETDLPSSFSIAAGEAYWLSIYREGGSVAFLWTTNPDSGADNRYGTSVHPLQEDQYLVRDGTFDVAWQIIPTPGTAATLAVIPGLAAWRRRRP